MLEWSNKWQFSYANWGPREPQMDDKKRCVLLDGNTGSLLNSYLINMYSNEHSNKQHFIPSF